MKIKPQKESPLPDVEVTMAFTAAEYAKLRIAAQMFNDGSVTAWLRDNITENLKGDMGELESALRVIGDKRKAS